MLKMANWIATLDISVDFPRSQNGELPIKDLIPEIIAQMKCLPQYMDEESCDNDNSQFLIDIIEDLQYLVTHYQDCGICDDVDSEEFDDVWSSFYQWADENRVWVKTF